MNNKTRAFSGVLAAVALVGATVAPIAANASEEGKRNTTIGLSAAAAALLLTQKNKLPGVVAAGGAAYAYSQYQNDINRRHKRARAYGYRNGTRPGTHYARRHAH